MSDNIPFEIQREIMQRLPVKSLIQFRSVSKEWKSLIDSPKFINDYDTRCHSHCLLVRYCDSPKPIDKYVSVVDDDSFPQHKIPMTVPMCVSTVTSDECMLSSNVSICTTQGLVCFSVTTLESHDGAVTMIAVLWNPAIRKSVDIVVPNVSWKDSFYTYISFGVSPHTNDPMLVKFTYLNLGTLSCIPGHVEVFKLSTGVWRSLCTNLPSKCIRFSKDHVAIDRFIYWIGHDVDDGGRNHNMIMSFDMISEMFEEISLPDCLTRRVSYNLNIFKLKESLVVLETNKNVGIQEYAVWIMEHGVPDSFRKLYTIKAPDASIGYVFEFRKSGEPIIKRFFNAGERHVTSVYDPCSQCFNDFVISDNASIGYVGSYQETLLLLDH